MESTHQVLSPTAEAFTKRFGAENTDAVLSAAIEHNNDVHNEVGSDVFKWAIAICVGYDCFSEGYSEYHGIDATQQDVKAWVRANAVLDDFDGTPDFLGLMAGAYNSWMSDAQDSQ